MTATMFLIEKRGLYYRPNDRGYTGIKDEAGRYTLDEVAVRFPNLECPNQDGMSFIAEPLAPDYSPACVHDVKEAHRRAKSETLLAKAIGALGAIEALTATAEGTPPATTIRINQIAHATLAEISIEEVPA